MRYLTFLYYSCWKHPTLSSLSLFALSFSLTYWSHSHGMLHNCWHLWTTLSCWHLWTGFPAWQITSQSSALCLSVCVSTVFTHSERVLRVKPTSTLHPSTLCFTAVRSLHSHSLLCPHTSTHTLNIITHWGASSKYYNPIYFQKILLPLPFPFHTCEYKKLICKIFKIVYKQKNVTNTSITLKPCHERFVLFCLIFYFVLHFLAFFVFVVFCFVCLFFVCLFFFFFCFCFLCFVLVGFIFYFILFLYLSFVRFSLF